MSAASQPTAPAKFYNSRWFVAVAILVVGAIAHFVLNERNNRTGPSDRQIRDVVGSEEVILELTPELKKLARGLLNLQLPHHPTGAGRFAETASVIDLEGPPTTAAPLSAESLAETFSFPVAAAASDFPRTELALWRPLLDGIEFFEHAALKLVSGQFVGDGQRQFETHVYFSAVARQRTGDWISLSADQTVTWQPTTGDGWEIAAWHMQPVKATRLPRKMFSDQLDAALPDPDTRRRARHSIHQEETIKYYLSGKTRARSHDFGPIAMNQKPALSVVDIDGDGFDDLYVMVRMGNNLLLRNRGDGTFEEIAANKELAIKNDSTCGIFADFDNDGDPDLMLGRSVQRTQYFENTGLWFDEVKDPWVGGLPYLAVSMAAADVNGDGLLDLYIATYRPEALGESNPGLNGTGGSGNTGLKWPDRFLPGAEAAEYHRLHNGTDHHFLDQIGPPNTFWINLGDGKFARSEQYASLEIWENSLQATWSDIDGDGDPDLYIANDFAPDCLFRNDGEDGFVDVAASLGIDVYGFGMGASFGDYDGDGRQDLYVTNMFSKAGRRILAQFEGIAEDYVKSVQGNVLYRRSADGFEHVSGLKKPALLVAKAGWSWGGQFADFDNDSDLDLYVLSGYFTAPAQMESDIDL